MGQLFPRATVVGVDTADDCRQYAAERIKIEIGSQDDRQFMTHVAKTYEPTVVIDDGSHRADHQIITFETVYPLLRPGACYIIEDTRVPTDVRPPAALGNS